MAVGCWLLAVGCWLLAVGCWLLAVGCWLLAVGCWLLAVGSMQLGKLRRSNQQLAIRNKQSLRRVQGPLGIRNQEFGISNRCNALELDGDGGGEGVDFYCGAAWLRILEILRV
jgi:hypothetical protein